MCISLCIWELKWNIEIHEIFLYRHLYMKISMCKYECGCKLLICTRITYPPLCELIISSQHKHKLFSRHQKSPVNDHTKNYNSITSSLVILYKYLFVHDFVRLAHGFTHILTKLYCFGSTFSLYLECLHSWPWEMVTLSSDSIAYYQSSNKAFLNSK